MQPKSNRFPDNLPPQWKDRLSPEAQEPYFKKLSAFLIAEKKSGKVIYPKSEDILRALTSLDLDQVKVVILGQDPYHGENQAIGLSFAVPNELRLKPPSLQNIFKELESDLGIKNLDRNHSDLSGWVMQGVLLLNTVLTVRKNQAFSHRDQGWERFTDRIIQILEAREDPVVFVLWGSHAQKKKALLTSGRHLVIESPHPSPLSAHRGFFGSRPFSKANQLLEKIGKKPIDWSQISI